MITAIPITKKEYDEARKEETAVRGETVKTRLLIIDKCRHDGFEHAGQFYFVETVGWHFKCNTIDGYGKLGGMD